jgi:hypothetical protein
MALCDVKKGTMQRFLRSGREGEERRYLDARDGEGVGLLKACG